MQFVGQLKKLDITNANPESMFVLPILENIEQTRLKLSQGKVTVL